ncbi:glutamate racemase [Ignatzschineria rhizosphaerae]|uniref:Glutamate racemase n=1 Tax=Ignatzschineria rhizosphaerae TaxID=2923279 RepID=A0ABY3X8L1_9GAMM|nr:glutamate racemase [Ignatzschineria rhizosphaerae]UNM97095.1 glutamate racemase [Ignatzschineria rhizosphaerae]
MLRIGLIDSGIGGFSILNAFLQAPTDQDIEFYYIADSGHLPYGLKTDEYIHQRMLTLTDFLLTKHIDALVIACNTATAVSASKLRTQYPMLPIIGTEPAIKPAALATQTGHIAVAATQSTLNSARLKNLISHYAQNCQVHKIIGTSWVDLVETQKITPSSNLTVLAPTLQVFQEYPIDQLVLGCTHFPFLAPALDHLLPASVTIIDPAPAIVQECYNRLSYSFSDTSVNHSKKTPSTELYLFTTGDLEVFTQQSSLLFSINKPLSIKKIKT